MAEEKEEFKMPEVTFEVSTKIERDGDGFYAYVPALKGLHTCGDTIEEAIENARDAAEAYIRSLIKHGDPIPLGIVNIQETLDSEQEIDEIETRELLVSMV